MPAVSGYTPTPRERGRPWRRRRAAWLTAHPLCCKCEERGFFTRATEVDHVIPLWKGGSDDDSNLQSLCSDDSKVKTAAEAKERAALGLMFKG
jgi:5-methylcytosine-specific restriction protein A